MPIELEPNCVGYAFKRLGINPEELYMDPREVGWEKYFDTVETAAEADAMLIIDSKNSLERAEVVHIAVLDLYNKEVLWHKPLRGAKERRSALSDVMFECFEKQLDVQFVKLKQVRSTD